MFVSRPKGTDDFYKKEFEKMIFTRQQQTIHPGPFIRFSPDGKFRHVVWPFTVLVSALRLPAALSKFKSQYSR